MGFHRAGPLWLTDARLAASAWYAIADPQKFPGIEVVFIQGVTEPLLDNLTGDFAVDGLVFRSKIDFVVLPTDYRSLAKNAGA